MNQANSKKFTEDLVRRLEELPARLSRLADEEINSLLSTVAASFSEATAGGSQIIDGAAELGARACTALLRLPVTLHSDTVAEVYWEVAKFYGVRRVNEALVEDLARRLIDIGRLSGSLTWKRKGYAMSAGMCSSRGDYATAIEHAWASLKLAKALGDVEGLGTSWNNLGIALAGCGLHQAARRCFEEKLAAIKDRQSEIGAILRRSGLNNLALSGLYLGDFEVALRAAEESRRLSAGDSSVRGRVLRIHGCEYLVRVLLECGDTKRAREVCNELLELGYSLDSETYEAEVELIDGLCRVFEGDVDAGLERVRRALDMKRRLPGELLEALAIAIRAHEIAGEGAAAQMYRRELALHNRLVQQEAMLAQHRAHLARLQEAEGTSAASLERKAEMVERLAITTELREDPTGLRVFRVGRLSRLLAGEVGWSEPDAEALEVAARLHDIGKISVADDVLINHRALTAEEMRSVHGHCSVGAELLRQTQLENARLAADVAAYHHETWDGSGYPHGIGGTAIPLPARIVAIADAFDAMTQDRPYRRSIGVEDALAQLQACAGTRYDPVLVPQFVALVRRLLCSVEDLDSYLAESADRSPFIRVNRQLAQRLAESAWTARPHADENLDGQEASDKK
jgi:putative two-component system response regulator